MAKQTDNTNNQQAEKPEYTQIKSVIFSNKKKLIFLFLGLIFFLLATSALTLRKSQTQPSQPLTSQQEVTPTPTTDLSQQEIPQDWKTYRNDEYGFELKHPSHLTLDLDPSHRGFISGSDYYGTRDFNFIIYDSKIEPSHEGFASDITGESTWQYDGYNFAFFSGDSATKHLSNKSDIFKKGDKYSPPLQKTDVNILRNNYPLYYHPPSNLPNTSKTSFWFVSFPLRETTVIITGNYDQVILRQILSTFKFLEKSQVNQESLKTEDDCINNGGVWQAWGLLQIEYCQIPATDSGKTCTDGSQCSLGICISETGKVPGGCQTYKNRFGCFSYIENGQATQALCID